MRQCAICSGTFPLSSFPSKGKNRFRYECKKCWYEKYRKIRGITSEPRTQCTACNKRQRGVEIVKSIRNDFNTLCSDCLKNKVLAVEKSRYGEKESSEKPIKRAGYSNKTYANQTTLDIFGTATYYKCAFHTCSKTASEWHHPNYKYPLDVIPVCRNHHAVIHAGEKPKNKLLTETIPDVTFISCHVHP
jgi:hypothetical protein